MSVGKSRGSWIPGVGSLHQPCWKQAPSQRQRTEADIMQGPAQTTTRTQWVYHTSQIPSNKCLVKLLQALSVDLFFPLPKACNAEETEISAASFVQSLYLQTLLQMPRAAQS